MPVTPQITILINLYDYSGAAIGSSSLPAFVRVALCGFYGNLPRISGTGMIGKAWSLPSDIVYQGSQISVPLWGNDVITPSGTFYLIEILDAKKNVIQAQTYQFAGSGTFDLSTIAPYNPPTPPLNVPNPVLLNPSGTQTINGSIIITGSLQVQGAFAFGFAASTVSFSATPTFNALNGNQFNMTLTGNVTSSSFINGLVGPYTFKLTQDGTGGRTFVWPANVKGAGVVDTTAGAINFQQFWWDGTNLTAVGPMISY